MKNQLPNLPSEVITVALGDIKKLQRRKKIVFDMSTYLEECMGTCTVCLAGATMLGTLKLDSQDWQWADISKRDADRLDFLNSVRRGNLVEPICRYFSQKLTRTQKVRDQLLKIQNKYFLADFNNRLSAPQIKELKLYLKNLAKDLKAIGL